MYRIEQKIAADTFVAVDDLEPVASSRTRSI